jgi:hypothetical protein
MMTLVIVMAGLVPAIHVFDLAADQGVDARHEAGHDDGKSADTVALPRQSPILLERESCA